ncbi:tripartite motif-containing protein 16-like isoform X2 [Electrophorus electricus]|uniref:tripartite motif-containing protein 16-like isoform X2 n=1 Tax=Electrophorus electricus TaxID=8005 RepID=UPI0015CFC694|nr:tripartite motif-containing protein 16-like isoform X2 [Electrophorus electricus]
MMMECVLLHLPTLQRALNQEVSPRSERTIEPIKILSRPVKIGKMAEDSRISVDHMQFSCSICLDLLKNPVTTPCGHSFCMECINDFWDHVVQGAVYTCPQCREAFVPRPVLRRNIAMAEVVEKLKRKELRSMSPTQHTLGLGDVECDICSESKDKAVRSCLVCLASFCETHLKPHYESPVFRKHKLVQPCQQLQDKVCAQHDKLIEIYCHTDRKFICSLCILDEHKGHYTASVMSERSKQQSHMKELQRKSQQKIHEKEKKLQDFKEAVNTLKCSAEVALEGSERTLTELLLSIEKTCCEVRELITAREKAELSRAEGLQEQLEQEIADLKRSNAELEQLSYTEDDIYFLQRFRSLCSASKAKDTNRVAINRHLSFDGVSKSLSDLKERIDEFCKDEFNKIHSLGRCILINVAFAKVQMVLPYEPKTREEFLQYFCRLTLDPNTTNEALDLSENNRKATRSGGLKQYPSHPERFDAFGQVLCKEGLDGRCYWEVEWNRGGRVYISVSYKGISRKGQGNECWLGHNSQSWSLECGSTLSIWHNNLQTKIPSLPSFRVGVYVDHSAGTLSFYSVADTMTLLYRVQTTFTQPLYPGFWINVLATAKLCECRE